MKKNWKLKDLREALEPYLHAAAPVVMRGGVRLLKGLQEALTKEALMKGFGHKALNIGPIPYHQTFKIEGRSLSLGEYIEQIEQDAAGPTGPVAPMYLFNRVCEMAAVALAMRVTTRTFPVTAAAPF